MPRRVALADDLIRLEPLTQDHVPAFEALVEDDDILRFTYLPTVRDDDFVSGWIARYEQGWEDDSRAGFAIVDDQGRVVGFAAIVHLDLDARQGELGYMVAREARGRGFATRAVTLLTDWALGPLGLARLELRIDRENAGSARVAEQSGYELEGTLRSLYFKEGRRTDVGVWSRLAAHDPASGA